MESLYKQHEFIKTIKDNDYPLNVSNTLSFLKSKYGYTLRISMLLQIIKNDFIGIREFDILDEKFCNNGLIESYCIDRFIDWQQGIAVNFSELFRKIKEIYIFSSSEKLLLEEGKIEEKLWALFLALSRSE